MTRDVEGATLARCRRRRQWAQAGGPHGPTLPLPTCHQTLLHARAVHDPDAVIIIHKAGTHKDQEIPDSYSRGRGWALAERNENARGRQTGRRQYCDGFCTGGQLCGTAISPHQTCSIASAATPCTTGTGGQSGGAPAPEATSSLLTCQTFLQTSPSA